MNIPYAMRRCTKCGEWLVANTYNFNKNKGCKWGLSSRCKKCNKEYREENKEEKRNYSKNWYKENKEEKRNYSKNWYKENKEEVLKKQKKHRKENKKEVLEKEKIYRENNRDRIRKNNKRWRENNKEHDKQYKKQWYENNKEYCKEKNKQWNENNKEYKKEIDKQWRENNKEKCFNNHNKRRNKENNQGRGINKTQWEKMFNFFDFKCAYSNIYLGNENNKNIRSVDHILALDNGGLNEPWNCVPMVKSYNSSKNKRVDVLNWYMEQEYFDIDRLNKIVEWQIYAFNKWATEEHELILITDLFEEEE